MKGGGGGSCPQGPLAAFVPTTGGVEGSYGGARPGSPTRVLVGGGLRPVLPL